MSKLKIFVMPCHNDGCTHYRINKPYKAMNDDGVIFFEASDLETPQALKYLEECDYVLCRQYHDKAIEMLDEVMALNNKKLKVILDMDDFVFDIDPYSESYEIFGTKEVKHEGQYLWQDGVNIDIKRNIEYVDSLKRFLNRSDILTVSTERLKERFKEYNNNIVVVNNAIDTKDWVYRELKPHNEIRIGWTGGVSHYADWFTVKDDVVRIMNEFPKAKLVIAGSLFEGTFKDIDKDRIEHWEWVDATGHGYRTMLMDLDLAIIPLKDSDFNSNKSCIKFYEFSSIKVPTICSNVAPYKDEAPKESLTNNFYESVKYYIENKDKAKEMAEKNYKWVMENRNQDKISKTLWKTLAEYLKEQTSLTTK